MKTHLLIGLVAPLCAATLSQATPLPRNDNQWKFKKGDALIVMEVQNDFMSESPINQDGLKARYVIPMDQRTHNGASIRAGSLAVSNTYEIVRNINCLVNSFEAQNLPVLYSLDWHPATHCSFGFNGTQENNPEYFHPHGAIAGPLKEGTTNEHNYPGIKTMCQDKRTREDWHNPTLGVMQWPQHCVIGTFGSRFSPFLKVSANAMVVKKGFNRQNDAYSAFGGAQSAQAYPFDTHETINDLQSRPTLGTLLKRQNVQRLFVVGIATDYCVKSTAVDAQELNFLESVNVLVHLTRAVSEQTKQSALKEMNEHRVQITAWDPTHPNLQQMC